MNRTVLWELDGVLADTTEAHFRSWVTALAEWEIPLTRETFRPLVGMRNDEILPAVLGRPAEPREQGTIISRKEHFFRIEAQQTVQLYPGVRPLLAELDAHGWSQALASMMPQATIDLIVDRLGIRNHFQAVISGEALLQPKPDPALLLEMVHVLRTTPGRCVLVDGTPAGVEAAQRAGMRSLAVAFTWSREALRAADHVVDELSQATFETFNQLVK
jgi:beta-phosphoglucomutase